MCTIDLGLMRRKTTLQNSWMNSSQNTLFSPCSSAEFSRVLNECSSLPKLSAKTKWCQRKWACVWHASQLAWEEYHHAIPKWHRYSSVNQRLGGKSSEVLCYAKSLTTTIKIDYKHPIMRHLEPDLNTNLVSCSSSGLIISLDEYYNSN